MKKHLNTILTVLGIIIICLLAFYYFGLPGKDSIRPESKFYFLDRWMESFSTKLSISKISAAKKTVNLVEERLYEINVSSASSDKTSQALINSIKKAEENISKLDAKNSAVITELLLNKTAESVLSFATIIGSQTPERSLELKDSVKENAKRLPANSAFIDSITKTIEIFEPEITTKGASISVASTSAAGIPALTSVNLNFINSKINAINKQTAQLNAVNIISGKGIVTAINVQRNIVANETIENNQVFFFKNSSNGLVYIKNEYFESELDITTFLAANNTFMNQLGITYEELDWLGYNHRQALETGDSLFNFY